MFLLLLQFRQFHNNGPCYYSKSIIGIVRPLRYHNSKRYPFIPCSTGAVPFPFIVMFSGVIPAHLAG